MEKRFAPKNCKICLEIYRWKWKSYNQLRNNLCQFKKIFQYVYSIVYPEIYCTTECRDFDLKSTFQLVLKTYKGKKSQSISVENQAVLQKKEMKYLSLNKLFWKLTILITRKKKMLMKKLKNEKKRWNS